MNTGRFITTALAATILAIPAMADAPGYFKVPGTDTTLKIYGKIQLREAYGLNGDGMNDVSYEGLPTPADVTAGGRENQDFQQKGQWSGSWRYYMGVTTTTPSSFGDVTTKIYGRFNHTSGAASGQSVKFNLEQAYVSIGGLEVGSDWSLFGYGAWEPNTLFGCVADEDGTWTNTRQIRYIFSPVKGLDLGVSLESHNSNGGDLTDGSATRGNSFGTSNNTHPSIDVVAAYSADWGGVTAAINRQDKTDWTKAGGDRSGTGTSWTVSGGWNITKDDQLTLFILKGGEGFGSWNDGFYASGATDYDFYKSLAISLSYTHTWNDQFSSALTVARTKWSQDNTAQTGLGYIPDTYKATELIANTTWNITKTVSLGVEFQHTQMKSDQSNWVDDSFGRTNKNKLDMFRLKLNATLW